MTLSLDQLRELPSPFYRVAVKALIFDDQQRLLMVLNDEGKPELPGGGWEHGESLEDCIGREIMEELGVKAASVSPIQFTFSNKTQHGWHALRLVVRAEITSADFVFGDGMTGARYVTRAELPDLDYVDAADAALKDCAEQIWPAA